MGQRSFFDVENRLQSVSKIGDPLERLGRAIPWENFRLLLKPVHDKERKSNAGRKPIDVVLMFKMLILQTLYNLADEQVEYQVRDRLKELGLMASLFDRFGDYLAAEGYQAKQGQMVEASMIRVPIQRNNREENRRLKRAMCRRTGRRPNASR